MVQRFRKEAMEYRIYFRENNFIKKHLKNKKKNVVVQLFEINSDLECLGS